MELTEEFLNQRLKQFMAQQEQAVAQVNMFRGAILVVQDLLKTKQTKSLPEMTPEELQSAVEDGAKIEVG